MIHMRDRDYDFRSGDRMRLTVDRATIGILWRALAAPPGAVFDGAADGRPVRRIAELVFGADRHQFIRFTVLFSMRLPMSMAKMTGIAPRPRSVIMLSRSL
jgi:hypothetical protein